MHSIAPKPNLNYIQSQSIEIIYATVSWPILDGLWKPIQSCFPDMWCDSSLAGVDRNERSDKEVQTLSPTARRRKADVWQIIKLTACSFFLTYRGTAQTELLPRDSRQSNHNKRQSGGEGRRGKKKWGKSSSGKMSHMSYLRRSTVSWNLTSVNLKLMQVCAIWWQK